MFANSRTLKPEAWLLAFQAEQRSYYQNQLVVRIRNKLEYSVLRLKTEDGSRANDEAASAPSSLSSSVVRGAELMRSSVTRCAAREVN